LKRRFFTQCTFLFFLIAVFIFPSVCNAAHPLITDDTGTQGKGNYQIEINAEFGYDKATEDDVTVKETGTEMAGVLSYGIRDSVDVVLGVPYQWNNAWEDGDMTSDENGISDMSLELKWRFFETKGSSLAVKPGMTLPTGDDEKGLGAGRSAYGICFMITKQAGPLVIHFNIGYSRNDNLADERKDIWHTNLASEVQAHDKLKLVANIGIEKNPDKTSHVDPAFVLGGFVYSITDAFDIDFGLKAGLNKPETDYTILAGTTFKF